VVLRSFVGGLGGKDISLGEFRHVLAALEHPRPGVVRDGAELLYTEADWRQAQKLVALAQPAAAGQAQQPAEATQ
jgi:hypothetical protein